MTIIPGLVDTCDCSLAGLSTAYTSLVPHYKASASLTTPHVLLLGNTVAGLGAYIQCYKEKMSMTMAY